MLDISKCYEEDQWVTVTLTDRLKVVGNARVQSTEDVYGN